VQTLLTRKEEGILIAYFQDIRIIDASRINALGQDLTNLLNASTNKKIILNFQNVNFMSSAMIGKLVLFNKQCKAAKVELRLCDINENVDDVFAMMKLGKVFHIDKDEETSISKLSKKGWFS